jgi:hypothetical protein
VVEGFLMSTRFHGVAAVMVLAVAVGAAGCGRLSFNSLKAKKAVREAHDLYRASHWQEATERYEVAIAADPTLPGAHFLLASS